MAYSTIEWSVPIDIRIISLVIILISWAIILFLTITLGAGVIGIDTAQGSVAIPTIVRFIFLPLGMLILRIYLWANARKYAFKLPDFRPVVIHDSSKQGEPFEVRVSIHSLVKENSYLQCQDYHLKLSPIKMVGETWVVTRVLKTLYLLLFF